MPHFHNETDPVAASFSFDDDVLKDAMRRLYEKTYNPLTEIDEDLFNEFWRIYNQAADEGLNRTPVPLDYADKDADFYDELKYNNGVFSAFKTHRFANDMASQLVSADGTLKSFAEWERDTAPIRRHHVRNWLETEYNTAVRRAHLAAEWRQFEREKDILPNLEWMETTSVTPGADHRLFWGVIRSIDDPFWNEHRPGDRWGCKCGLRSTDKAITPLPPGIYDPKFAPAPGLNNNPGRDAMLFSFSHPYFAAAYWAYKKLKPVVERLVKKEMQKGMTVKTVQDDVKKLISGIRQNGYAKKNAVIVGTVPDKVVSFAKKHNIQVGGNNILMSDSAIKHALRPEKVKAGKSVTEEEIINFPKYAGRAGIYFDAGKENFLFVVRKNGRTVKYVFEPNYLLKANGVKRREFTFITAGVINDRILKMGVYTKIK